MSRSIETKDYGEVEVSVVMFDIDGTNLEEGIEIKGGEIGLIEVCGWRDLDDLSSNDINSLITQNWGIS